MTQDGAKYLRLHHVYGITALINRLAFVAEFWTLYYKIFNMKQVKNNMPIVILLLAMAFSLTSCYESRYNRRYHHHTRGWYDRRHRPPPAGVDFSIDVRNR